MKLSRRGRRSVGDRVVDELAAADRFPVGDQRRSAAQRRVARMVADDISIADDPRLSGVRSQLRQWAHFAPHLLSDELEARLATDGRALIAEQLECLRSLEHDEATALAAADAALRGLDSQASADRRLADIDAHAVTDLRAPMVASVLGALAACHLADDEQRHIHDWRTRFAVVQGTTPATLTALRDATLETQVVAAQWWAVRSSVVAGSYCDRRAGLPASPATLDDHSRSAAAAMAHVVPSLASAAQRASGRVVHGSDNQVTIEADGRLAVTVAHRPTPRGSLMVAHEIGHAVHALESSSPEPPGALVGETVACWAALVTGQFGLGGPQSAAMALALGDTLIEELFVSSAVSAFEDLVFARVAAGSAVTVEYLNAAWLHTNRAALGGAVDVPDHVGSGWARLPALATDPGHAFSYVWATVLALAISARHGADADGVIARAIRAGGVEADEFTALLGFHADEWIPLGLTTLDVELTRLAQMVRHAR